MTRKKWHKFLFFDQMKGIINITITIHALKIFAILGSTSLIQALFIYWLEIQNGKVYLRCYWLRCPTILFTSDSTGSMLHFNIGVQNVKACMLPFHQSFVDLGGSKYNIDCNTSFFLYRMFFLCNLVSSYIYMSNEVPTVRGCQIATYQSKCLHTSQSALWILLPILEQQMWIV